MKLRLKVDPERITLDDLIAIEEGNAKSRSVRDMLSRFAVDEAGNFLPPDEAKEIVGQLTLADALAAGQELSRQVKNMMDGLVPTPTVVE